MDPQLSKTTCLSIVSKRNFYLKVITPIFYIMKGDGYFCIINFFFHCGEYGKKSLQNRYVNKCRNIKFWMLYSSLNTLPFVWFQNIFDLHDVCIYATDIPCNQTCHEIPHKLSHFSKWLLQLSIYTNKTGDCLSVCLSVCLFICSAMGGQTARPNGLKFGG